MRTGNLHFCHVLIAQKSALAARKQVRGAMAPAIASEKVDSVEKEDDSFDAPTVVEQVQYSLPPPPQSWLFGGLGYGYGLGCAVGPCFGVGVGISPLGVQFGAGATLPGIFCGVGLAAGAIVGEGKAYVPIGLNSSFFYAPRFMWFEHVADLHRRRAERRRRNAPGSRSRSRAIDTMWPSPVRRMWASFLERFKPLQQRKQQQR